MYHKPTDLTKLFYIINGDIKAGFMTDLAGKPYMLAFLGYRGSGNLLETDEGRGMEMQACLFDGYIEPPNDFDYDTTNPTQGGGNYGRILPVVKFCEIEKNQITAVLPALDFDPPTTYMGDYKRRMLAGRYPETGWDMQVTYTVEDHAVQMDVAMWITDEQQHNVYAFRPMVLHLNPTLFQYPLINESKRDQESWLKAVIKDNKIQVKSIDNQTKVTITAGGVPGYYSHRCFIEKFPTIQNQDGTGDVWESMYVWEPRRWFLPTDVLTGWARIELQPARFAGDLQAMIKNVFAAIKARRKTMKIICDDGTKEVTETQFNWLNSTGKLVDMSSHPGPADTGYFSGDKATLEMVLLTMPAGWEPPVVTPPVVEPPAGDFETQALSKLDYIIELLEK